MKKNQTDNQFILSKLHFHLLMAYCKHTNF